MPQTYTHSYIKPVIQAWLRSFSCVEVCDNPNQMCIDSEVDTQGVVTFYDYGDKFEQPTMELEIYDPVDSEDPSFYLHFEMHDFEFVMEKISVFFKYLYREPLDHAPLQIPQGQEPSSVLLCCSSGITSSFIAQKMQQEIDECETKCMKIRGRGIDMVDQIADEFDLILVAPQIAFKYEELKSKYGEKVMMIDNVVFATMNFHAIFEMIFGQCAKIKG